MSVPQSAISKITFTERRVDTEESDSSQAEFLAPVVGEAGTTLGDAGKILNEAISVWESKGMKIALGA